MNQEKTRALIVGGGFGGVKVAQELSNTNAYDVTLLSDSPSFYYYPTMYHTATGGKTTQSAIPVAQLLEDKKVTFVQGTATGIDRTKKVIKTKEGKDLPYDVLVLALGAVPNYFGIKGIQEHSYNIRNIEAIRAFKKHLHEQLEDLRKPDLNYVVVGGGPTGIELSGALSHYLYEIMHAHGVERRAVHIDLVEAMPKLVPRMPARMSKRIAKRLRSMGVKLYLKSAVQGATADSLTINGKEIQSHTIIWTAGVTNHPFFKQNEFALNERGKVVVDEYMQSEPDIYVIGDNADTKFSGMAQTALYDALFVAENLIRQAKGQLMKRYTPKEPIYVIPVGEWWAAVLWGKVQIYGFPGWVLRTLADLVAFKDYQPWWKAGRQWLTEFETEEECLTCREKLG
jgi:NADH dehydrogenase